MRFSLTFSLYVVRNLLINLLYVFLVFSFIGFILDFLELMRESQGKTVLFSTMLQIVLYKIPFITMSFMPFVFLFGAILTFTKLNNSFELAAAKSVGISIWSLCIPIAIAVILVSAFILFVFQPISSALLDNNRILLAKHLGHGTNKISLQDNGVWLYDQTDNPENDKIIYIMHISNQDKTLSNVVVYSLGPKSDFSTSYIAETASIDNGFLLLHNVKKYMPGVEAEYFANISLPSNFTKEQIQDSIPNPELIQFWELPNFIKRIKQSGFSDLKHDLYFKSLIVSPLLYLSLVFIALVCSISLPRAGKLGIVFVIGAVIGIFIFFINKMVNVMALTGALPISLAVVAPSISYLLLSGAALIHSEEG